jgi:hypothetical protein
VFLNYGSETFFVSLPWIENSRSEEGSHPQGRSAAEEARSALTPFLAAATQIQSPRVAALGKIHAVQFSLQESN